MLKDISSIFIKTALEFLREKKCKVVMYMKNRE